MHGELLLAVVWQAVLGPLALVRVSRSLSGHEETAAAPCRPESRENGPSWVALLSHTKGGLWSLVLFRTESMRPRCHWVLVGMDQFTHRILGFGMQALAADGRALCSMFNYAISPTVSHAFSEHTSLQFQTRASARSVLADYFQSTELFSRGINQLSWAKTAAHCLQCL